MVRPSLAAAVLVLAVSVPSFAQEEPQAARPVIVAQGEAVIERPADLAWVQIGVDARGDRPEDARQRAADAMTAVLAALGRQVPRQAIQTAAFSVVPEMDYTANGSRLKDYLARNRVEVRVDDLDKLPAVMDAGVASGASTVSGIRFDVKERTRIERDALGQAVEDAIARARAMAAGAGQKVGAIIRIQEQRQSSPPVVFSGERSLAMAGRAQTSTPILPGTIEIRAMATVAVAIE
jgi:uncharacterized protein YggE